MTDFHYQHYRRASRSDSSSLVLTKENFLDTLFVTKSSKIPLYATITQAGSTVLYAVDTTMALQAIAAVNWGKAKSGQKDPSVTIKDNTYAWDEILPSRKLQGLMGKPSRKYACGPFICTWGENDDHAGATWVGAGQAYCFKPPPPGQTQSPSASQQQSSEGTLLASLEFCPMFRNKPKVQLHILERELLSQIPGEDGLTDLDHVVLGAVLLNGGSFVQRKSRPAPTPAGWMDQQALQDLLWSANRVRSPGAREPLPLYTLIASVVGEDGVPPPYASRISLIPAPRGQA